MPSVELVVAGQRVPPVRGLVLTHNAAGQALDRIDLLRWIRLNREILKLEKVDVFLIRLDRRVLPDLVAKGAELGVKVSLRTNCVEGPEALGLLNTLGLFDVFLTPVSEDAPYLNAWFAACGAASLPMRLQLQAPFGPGFDAERMADAIAAAGVAAVNVTLEDPFLKRPPCRDAAASGRTVEQMNALVSALDARNVEANLLHLPFCQAAPANLVRAENYLQFYLDHQQYHQAAYELASKVFPCNPNAVAKAIIIPLGRNAAWSSHIDAKLLPWIVEGSWKHTRLLIWRKLTRKLRVFAGKQKPLESETAYERALERSRAHEAKALGSQCSQCRLRRICDRESEPFKRLLPGRAVTAQPGELALWPLQFSARQRKYYDPIDADRVAFSERYLDLAREAKDILANATPTREVDSYHYKIEGQWTHQMPGGSRWYSFTNSEKLSTPLTRTMPPLTMAVTFGGGIAEYVGFSFGRHCKLLCPMESYSHQVVLHVDAAGHYVLLRDGIPMRPAEFEGVQYVPVRLSGVLEPQIAIWNIDGSIVTQTVLLWEGNPTAAGDLQRVKYSVIIVSTRYSRRLESVLLSLAHQTGINLEKIEVIISYVPGIDATDDVIESLKLAHPQLRIVRAPFAEGNAKSKGFLINESARLASGEWVVLLDSDILLPPGMFAAMEGVSNTSHFLCPDGRKMLTPEDTAKVLLGELQPWRDWDALMQTAGEFRAREADGVPIGFFQAVRKTCIEKTRYIEMDHFEGADWAFGASIRKDFGKETRLTGLPVLHLDHGGSQWYGTQKQR